MAIYKKAFTFVGFGSCLGVSRSTGAGFSVPTEAELRADTIEATTTAITNNEKALNSFLKLPVAGYRAHDAFLEHKLVFNFPFQ
jgi:hypothetical protein